jgi:hypothetical protein
MKKSIKNLEVKEVKNIQTVKGGDGPIRPKILNIQGGTDVNP